MRNDRDILFDIEKLGYKYEFCKKNVILKNELLSLTVVLRKSVLDGGLEIVVSSLYEDLHYLTKEEIKEKQSNHKVKTYEVLPLDLLKYINELAEYYTKEGFYEDNNQGN